jgi:nitrogen regulatory protein PII
MQLPFREVSIEDRRSILHWIDNKGYKTKVETIVPDSVKNKIVDDILNNLYSGKEPHGIIFVKDVSDAYVIRTEERGESILSIKEPFIEV